MWTSRTWRWNWLNSSRNKLTKSVLPLRKEHFPRSSPSSFSWHKRSTGRLLLTNVEVLMSFVPAPAIAASDKRSLYNISYAPRWWPGPNPRTIGARHAASFLLVCGWRLWGLSRDSHCFCLLGDSPGNQRFNLVGKRPISPQIEF